MDTAAVKAKTGRPRGSEVDPSRSSFAFTELASEDPAVTRQFLERVFRWSFRAVAMPQGEYFSFEIPGGGRGGIRATQPTEAPSSLSYIRVTDLDRVQARIERAGGTVVLPRVNVPGMGSFFWFKIPGGPILACWQDVAPGGERKP